MKKPAFLILVASFALVLLSVGLVSAQEPVNLVFWSMWNETEGQALVLQEAIAKYQAANPNVTISAVWNGRQNQTLVRTALSGGTVIDIVDQDEDQIAGGLMREGFGLPLNAYLDQPALDHEEPLRDVFLPGTLDMFNLEGETYLIPYIYNTVQFWYDKRSFADAGIAAPPATWDELLAACDALNAAGYAPIAAEGNEPGYAAFYLTEILARTKGPGWLRQAAADPTGEMWKDPAVVDAAQKTRDLWDKGCVPPETVGYVWPQGQQTLAVGTAGMELVGSWLPVELQTMTDPDFQWGGFSFPAIEGGAGSVNDVYALLLAFMINKDTAHPDEAFDFLRFVMSDEIQQAFTDNSLVGVTNKYITWNPIIADAQAAASVATTTYGDVDNVASLYSEYLNTILYPNYVEVWQGKLAPQEFSDRMATQTAEYWASRQS